MANQPPINRNALLAVKRATTGPIPVGRGCILVGTYSADGFALVDVSSGEDGLIHGVTYEIVPDDTNTGFILLAGQSIVRLRVGATAVKKDDKLNLQDNTGVFQPAKIDAINIYYVALQDAAAGALCYASPIASSPSAIKLASGSAIGTTSSPTRTATTYTTLEEMSTSIACKTGKVFVQFSGTFSLLPGDQGMIAMFVDGVEVGNTQKTVAATLLPLSSLNGLCVSTQALLTGLSVTTHTITIQWKAMTGSMRAVGIERRLDCIEI